MSVASALRQLQLGQPACIARSMPFLNRWALQKNTSLPCGKEVISKKPMDEDGLLASSTLGG